MINKGHVVLNQPIDIVQQEFNQEKILVSTKKNELLKKYLDINNYNYSLEKGVFRIAAKDKKACKILFQMEDIK